MNSETKIILAHKGRSWYLPYALYQAQYVSPESEVILIGDSAGYEGIDCQLMRNLHSEYIEQFAQQYVHMSSNPKEFELFCWLRWFYLLEYMRTCRVQSVLYLDSDVLLFSSVKEMSRLCYDSGSDCGFLIPKQDYDSFKWAASAHVSYWKYETLEEFCRFCIKSFSDINCLNRYRQKFNWHLERKEAGGICDMTALYLFWNENKSRIQNLAVNFNGHTFDNSFNSCSNYCEDDYKLVSGKKIIKWIDKRPYWLADDKESSLVRVNAFHFQGSAKKRIPGFYMGKAFGSKWFYDAFFSCVAAKDGIFDMLRQNVPGAWRIIK